MAEQSGGWWRGCLLGCAGLAALPILALSIVTFRTWLPLRSAGVAQRQLESRFGRPDAFVPPPDGVVDAGRIRTFLEVREAMTAGCGELQSMQGRMQDLEEIEHQSEPTGAEVADGTLALGDLAANITPWVGRFFKDRNRALLDAGMGLGEYSFLFMAAYRERFLDGSLDGELFCEEGRLSIGAGMTLAAVLTNQLDAARRDGLAEEEIRRLEDAVDELGEDGMLLPWPNGPPERTSESLASFRGQLDSLFCPATACIELDPNSKRAMAIALE